MTLLSNHIKIALRNLWKFKIQTVVCVLGLSVGMACFALGTLWLRYIESFEDFVPDAENICLVSEGVNRFRGTVDYTTSYPTGRFVKEYFPQVKDHCCIELNGSGWDVKTLNGDWDWAKVAMADTSFLRVFGIEALEGSLEHLSRNEVIFTKSVARRLFGEKPAVGKQLYMGRNLNYEARHITEEVPLDESDLYTVVAVVKDCPSNTQFAYDAILPFQQEDEDRIYGYFGEYMSVFKTFVRFHEKADIDTIIEREIKVPHTSVSREGKPFEIDETYTIIPIKKLRADYPAEVKISTQYVRWFMLLGALVILCSLVNYLITMVNHLRRRAWEMSLRRVLGASIKTILAMVSTETLLTFLISAVFGWFFVWAALPFFRDYSDIYIPLSEITAKVCGYLALVIAAGCAVSAFVAWIVMKKTQQNILGARQLKHSSTLLDRVGVILQLALSMGILFSVSILYRQINFLMYSDELGFTHDRLISIQSCDEATENFVKHSPLVESYVKVSCPLFPKIIFGDSPLMIEEENIIENFEEYYVSQEILDFYHGTLVAGRLPEKTAGPQEICLNETGVRTLGLTNESAIGKKVKRFIDNKELVVTGIVRDMYVLGPVVAPSPVFYLAEYNLGAYGQAGQAPIAGTLAVRAKTGMTQELNISLNSFFETNYAEVDIWERPRHENAEARYNDYLKSEQMLIRILLAVALCSLFVCVLGAFSLVSLSLTERRKEIAIRKAHGAHISDILQLFLRSHYLSLAIAALIAYPLSYIIMRNWLENYSKQVGIDWWLIPATFLLISCVVIATISFKIYFAAKEKAARALVG